MGRIGEERNSPELETNPLAIVLDPNPLPPPPPHSGGGEAAVKRVKKEEAETKINAWQNAKVAKINNRFKREEAIINGWEDKQVHEASSSMKHVEVRRDPLFQSRIVFTFFSLLFGVLSGYIFM